MKRVNKWQVTWRILIIVSMLINVFQLQSKVLKAFTKQPAIKRFVVLATIDRVIDKIRR